MDPVEQLRRFNRDWMRAFGLLGRNYLRTGLGVTEVRVLWELGYGTGTSARRLAQVLGLDEGQLSRILRGFETRGWLARTPDEHDGRRRHLGLTAEGRAALAPIEALSDEDLGARLAALPPLPRAALLDAIDAAQRALAADAEVEIRDMAPGDIGWVIERHAALYARDEGYDAQFETLVSRILADWLAARDPARERAFIAWGAGRRQGSVFCFREDDTTARLRLFLIEPGARGIGLGRRMLRECLHWVASRNYRRMVLWTHESHRAAGALYASQGFVLRDSTPTLAFGQEVVDQVWDIDIPVPDTAAASRG
jgi:DNA-binding MarR family transcriptional regulator